jgi:hypothetical protein
MKRGLEMRSINMVMAACVAASLAAAPALAQTPAPPGGTPAQQQYLQDQREHRAAHDEELHKDKEIRAGHEADIKSEDAQLHQDERSGNMAAAHEEAAKIRYQDRGLHQDKKIINHQKHDVKKDNHIIHKIKNGHG